MHRVAGTSTQKAPGFSFCYPPYKPAHKIGGGYGLLAKKRLIDKSMHKRYRNVYLREKIPM
ncbi:hypothetical protein KSD_40650 [Ktedonobacter sp. SOSP1-85]|nr:hypothetical protein KSD_40650 [Ktedonobacter sp. SOSP1-85]